MFKVGDVVQLRKKFRNHNSTWFKRMMDAGNKGVISKVDDKVYYVKFGISDEDGFYEEELELYNIHIIDGK